MKHRLPLLVFLGLLATGPAFLPEFYVTLLNYIGLYSIVALGLVLLTGVGGLTSFGQAAFVGLGAYATGYLTTAHELSPWLGLLAGLGVTAAVALVLGFLTLRLSGHYLPLGTIAWGISLYFLFGNLEFLGGHTGLTGIPVLEFFGLKLSTGREFYYLIWVVLLGDVLATQNLLDSREGRAIRALKGGGLMAESMGVDTARTKTIIFLIAALFACVRRSTPSRRAGRRRSRRRSGCRVSRGCSWSGSSSIWRPQTHRRRWRGTWFRPRASGRRSSRPKWCCARSFV